LNKLDLLGGTIGSYSIKLAHLSSGEKFVLDVSRIAGRLHAVRLALEEGSLLDLGSFPEIFERRGDFMRVQSAGPQAREGLFLVDGAFDDFALWYKPPDARWLRVIRGVHILKAAGGETPWLPVAYLGARRFAVAKTAMDGGPPAPPAEGPEAPPVSSTMLIDGMTGRIIEETTPRAYDYMPELDIPDAWWSGEARAGRKRQAEQPVTVAPITWVQESSVYRFKDGRTVKRVSGEEAALSRDGRRLAIYREWTPSGGPPARIRFRIFDAETEGEKSVEISLEEEEAFVRSASWEVLTGHSPRPEDLGKLNPDGQQLWLDRW